MLTGGEDFDDETRQNFYIPAQLMAEDTKSNCRRRMISVRNAPFGDDTMVHGLNSELLETISIKLKLRKSDQKIQLFKLSCSVSSLVVLGDAHMSPEQLLKLIAADEEGRRETSLEEAERSLTRLSESGIDLTKKAYDF
ncbi:hypothetical protein YC2023_085435 [Brassica napus]